MAEQWRPRRSDDNVIYAADGAFTVDITTDNSTADGTMTWYSPDGTVEKSATTTSSTNASTGRIKRSRFTEDSVNGTKTSETSETTPGEGLHSNE